MSAHRMISALLVLQQRGTVTAAELADELEVSERTARRVLDSLAVAGIPVYSRAGRNGGWSLVGGARTDLTGLTAAEAQALFLVAGPNATASPELRDALRKLVGALPASFRAQAEAAAGATVIDPDRWGGRRDGRDEPFLDALRLAVIEAVRIDLGYANRSGIASKRTVSPFGLVDKRGVRYLVAGTDVGLRTFRVDRVTSVDALDETFERPAGFDLDAAWRELSSSFESSWPMIEVDVAVEPDWWGLASHFVDGRVERTGTRGDGWIEARFEYRAVESAAGQLAGFAGLVDVLDPPEVQRALAEVGHRLVEHYGGG